mmetsp:Transcript_4894/g.20019  ORF Transcript_4894/g.20019 Transcript_4894/m.20019 type:complete len:284 (+) Transcript_4894:568-1419(+)
MDHRRRSRPRRRNNDTGGGQRGDDHNHGLATPLRRTDGLPALPPRLAAGLLLLRSSRGAVPRRGLGGLGVLRGERGRRRRQRGRRGHRLLRRRRDHRRERRRGVRHGGEARGDVDDAAVGPRSLVEFGLASRRRDDGLLDEGRVGVEREEGDGGEAVDVGRDLLEEFVRLEDPLVVGIFLRHRFEADHLAQQLEFLDVALPAAIELAQHEEPHDRRGEVLVVVLLGVDRGELRRDAAPHAVRERGLELADVDRHDRVGLRRGRRRRRRRQQHRQKNGGRGSGR